MAEAKRLDKFLSECFELSRSIIGKEVRAKHVSVNGEVQRQNLGKWGSAASSARNKAAFFSGTGVMNFMGEGTGTMLIFR